MSAKAEVVIDRGRLGAEPGLRLLDHPEVELVEAQFPDRVGQEDKVTD